jgi:hypothetical protein
MYFQSCMPDMFFVFKKKPQTQLESLVSWIAGKMVHVDISPGKSVMFTSFMFEPFSINKFEGYSKDTHTSLKLAVTSQEFDNINSLLISFVQKKIPYNYHDLINFMVPLTNFGGGDEDPKNIDSLFCSQAATLILKNCITENLPLIEKLQTLNSKTTSPNILYETLLPFCECDDEFF